MIGAKEPRATTMWDDIGPGCYGDWRQLIELAADAAEAATPQLPAVAALDAVIDRVARTAPLDPALHRALADAAFDQAAALYGAGVLLGAALVRTWPSTIDGMGDWPARALAEAGLTDDGEGDDGDDGTGAERIPPPGPVGAAPASAARTAAARRSRRSAE